jgi:hypothetical protein
MVSALEEAGRCNLRHIERTTGARTGFRTAAHLLQQARKPVWIRNGRRCCAGYRNFMNRAPCKEGAAISRPFFASPQKQSELPLHFIHYQKTLPQSCLFIFFDLKTIN